MEAAPLTLPGKAKDVTGTSYGFMVLLEDGSVYAPSDLSDWDGTDAPKMSKLNLPTKATAVPDADWGETEPLQVDLPVPAKTLAGGGWVALRNGSLAHVNYGNGNVLSIDPAS